MSWIQWFATVIVAFVFWVGWVGAMSYLIHTAEASMLRVLEHYLKTKKALITELEEELGENGPAVKKKFGSN